MFKFNFNKEEDHPSEAETENEGCKMKWFTAKEHSLCDAHLEQINEDADINTFNFGGNQDINYLDSESVSLRLQYLSDSVIGAALSKHSDLVPGVYEGGLKIWECSQDMVHYLHKATSHEEWQGKRVLEIGCGAGLPGLFCFLQGSHVDFQDYNADVIENITIPNVLINAPTYDGTDLAESRFLSGDWTSVEALIREKKWNYDVIITTETIYNVESQAKLISLMDAGLKKEGGRIYLAAKSHYFGVGGGLKQFQKVLEKEGKWTCENVETFGSELKREILLISRSG